MSATVSRRVAAALLRRIQTGRLTVVEGDERTVYGSGAPAATVEIRSPRTWARLRRGSRGLAESYVNGWWDTPDLTALIQVAARNATGLDRLRRRLGPLLVPAQRGSALLRPYTRRRSRHDIASHYDLGNELFELMLDPTMAYSCAVFERPGMSLEQASVAKFERVLERLEVSAGDELLEIGTGWGGLAVHAAATRGCRVTTTTISREQHDYARRRAREAGVENLVTVLLEDYRDLRGSYDKLVSIEMIEAVGWRHFGRFFDTCSKLLAPHGLMLLQAITIDDRAYAVEKAGRSFANTYVFPNGCLPSLEVIARCVARRTDMRMVQLDDITPHYAETLRRWRQNFAERADDVRSLYGERFVRLWSLYLSYCEAGFRERRIGDVQLLLAKPDAALPGVPRAAAALSEAYG